MRDDSQNRDVKVELRYWKQNRGGFFVVDFLFRGNGRGFMEIG